ncbi:hypothetical protein PWG71_27875 [Nocardiopsis sp. N85]|uniref:hypothetical protein n=1 Tax=Nocardiopsis sp. N85 TaxID=3029400 RepID=UPI00237FBD24|nr:hypothetical protein [Nocardiopsis sp. N85]MDE3725217.1 hypothetical protein [Nocardiopsis sp. N85]
MAYQLREHAGRHYAIQLHYALPDDSWAVELSEAQPRPGPVPEALDEVSCIPGKAFLVAFVPDEDPALEPTVHIHGHDDQVIPYEIMRWFMEVTTGEAERCRATSVEKDSEATG